MGTLKDYFKLAIKLAITLIVLNLIIGAIEYFAKLGQGQVAKYIYNPLGSIMSSTNSGQ